MSATHSRTRTLVEAALMIALGTVLSLFPLSLVWTRGGSITLLSMLPIIMMSLRHGTKWGLGTAFLYSLIQFVQGISNLAYCQTVWAQIGCILFDYLLAFTALGLGRRHCQALQKPAGRRCRGHRGCLPDPVCLQLSVRLHCLEGLRNCL